MIIGAWFNAATVIENAGKAALAAPSDTLIRILPEGPAEPVPGVPASWPLAVLNDAQVGLPAIENASDCPSGSDALGTKL